MVYFTVLLVFITHDGIFMWTPIHIKIMALLYEQDYYLEHDCVTINSYVIQNQQPKFLHKLPTN